MRRRDVLRVLGLASMDLASASGPLPAQAQQGPGRVRRIGYLHPGARDANPNYEKFKRKLLALGYVEGQNLSIEARFAAYDLGRLPELARDLVQIRPDAIVAVATPAVLAAQKATSTIPIVMADIGDPIGAGFVKSLARPGANIIGTANMTVDYIPKTIELLRELLPQVRRVAAVMSQNPTHALMYNAVEAAARTAAITLVPAVAAAETDLDAAFTMIAEQKCDAIIVFTDVPRFRIVSLAARARLPAIYQIANMVDAGGLISYGADSGNLLEQAAIYLDRIFKGADPAELPVEQPTRFALRINLLTAKQLGLTIPPSLLARADEVIE